MDVHRPATRADCLMVTVCHDAGGVWEERGVGFQRNLRGIMYAQLISVSAGTAAIEEWLTHVRRSVVPLLKQQAGNLGLTVLQSGDQCMVVTYWDHDHQPDATSSAWARAAETAAGAVRRQEAEVAFLVQARLPTTGNTVDFLAFRLRSDQVYAAIARFEANLLPRLESDANFVGVTVMTDIPTGMFQVLITWSDAGPEHPDVGGYVHRGIAGETGTAARTARRYSLVETLSLSEKA